MTGNEKSQNAGLVHLPQLGLVRVSGADAVTFLQGQLSNDVREVVAARGQLASFNSPKGRMLAVMHLLRTGDDLLLEIHRDVLDATVKRLRMFVLRAKVTLENLGDAWATIGIYGESARDALAQLKLPSPAQTMDCAPAGDILILRRAGEVPRYTLHGPTESIRALQAQLAGHLAKASVEAWKQLDIESGTPTIYSATSDHFVAQMCNLDQLGGINFKKGCYTGQEIVARLHYLGTLKRRMFRGSVNASANPGDPIFDANGDTQAAGEVVDALNQDGKATLLAVLQINHVQGDLRLGNNNGAVIQIEAAHSA